MTEENVDLHLMFQNYIVGLEKNVALCCISLGPIHNCCIVSLTRGHMFVCFSAGMGNENITTYKLFISHTSGV